MPQPMTTQASLFDPAYFARERRRQIVECARDLRALARRRAAMTVHGQPEWGVSAEDTFQIARRKGFATGSEREKRALSWFSAVPVVARLYNSGRKRPGRNRNAHTVYTFNRP